MARNKSKQNPKNKNMLRVLSKLRTAGLENPTPKRIAKETGIPKQEVRELIAEAAEKGWISRSWHVDWKVAPRGPRTRRSASSDMQSRDRGDLEGLVIATVELWPGRSTERVAERADRSVPTVKAVLKLLQAEGVVENIGQGWRRVVTL